MLDKLVMQSRLQMDRVLEDFKSDLRNIHSGKASSALVEDMMVNHYNQQMPVKQLATITTPDASSIVITPWDKGAVQSIVTAIEESGLSIKPSSDGNAIRLSFPPPSAERREELVRIAHKKAEEARVAMRQGREDIWKTIQSEEKKGSLTEDDRYAGEKQLNKLIEEHNTKIKELVEGKEKEIREF